MPRIPIHNLGHKKRTAFAKTRNSDERNLYNKLYNNRRYRRLRSLFLQSNPLCIECKKNNKVVAAEVLDHIIPHRGNVELFWDENNWQSLCKTCHNAKSGRESKG